jgi:hypothetical protein
MPGVGEHPEYVLFNHVPTAGGGGVIFGDGEINV